MDVRRYKLASPSPATWPGGLRIWFRPLPTVAVQTAALRAADAPPRTAGLRRVAEVLAASITPQATADDLLTALLPRQIYALAMDFIRAQDAAHAHWGRLGTWLRKSVNDMPEMIDDALMCWHAETAADYYGRALVDLTQAQVAWYMLARAAFKEFHVDQPKKYAGRAWLEVDREERMSWQMRD